MPFHHHLSDDEINKIHAAAIRLGLAGARKTLLGSVGPGYVDTLPMDANPSAQLRSDLQEMNAVEHLDDPEKTVPLQRWLSTALHLNSIRVESRVFKSALDALAAKAAPPRPDPDRPIRHAPVAANSPPAKPPVALRWSSKLSGPEMKELADALRSAFPGRDALAQMLLFSLDKRLDEIAGSGNLSTTVFELVTAAQAQGWVPQLFDAALAEVPGNPELQAIAAKRRV